MKKPKILYWDVESSYMAVYCFGLWKQNVAPANIIDHSFLISIAWKWEGDKKSHVVSVLDDKERFAANHKDDFYVVSEAHKVLSEADIIVHHNGDKFDLKKFNKRAIAHGLPPLPHIHTVDTMKVAKKHFLFESNSLNHIAQFLGVGNKMHNPPGLWRDATEGCKKAIKHMAKYNKVDVDVLQAVYKELRPYHNTHPNMSLLTESDKQCCTKCGSTNLISNGYRTTSTMRYRRLQCQDCGAWSKERTAEFNPNADKLLTNC